MSTSRISLVLLAGMPLCAHAEDLVRYEAPGGSFDPTYVAPGFFASLLNTTGAGTGQLSPGNAFPHTVYHGFGGVHASPTAAIAAGQFFAFTLDPMGQSMSLEEFTLDAARGGNTGLPRGWALLSSVDGFTSILGSGDIPTLQPSVTPFVVSLSAGVFQNVTEPVTFRIYSYAGTGSGAGNFYDNITVVGTIGSPCYANCDGSSTEPILTVDDFTCFINEFAAAQSLPHEQQVTHYANCDQSTTAPVLTVDDFTCFINAFAAGCR